MIGNTIKLLDKPKKPESRLIEAKGALEFVNLVSWLAGILREKGRVRIEIVSDDDFKFKQLRAKYFAYLNEKQYQGEGKSVSDLHEDLKGKYLARIIASYTQELEQKEKLSVKQKRLLVKLRKFIDLLISPDFKDATKEDIEDILSLADGSLIDYEIMSRYFDTVQHHFNDYEGIYATV